MVHAEKRPSKYCATAPQGQRKEKIGAINLTKVTEGVGLLSIAVILAIWARLWQAHHQHAAAKKQFETLMDQLQRTIENNWGQTTIMFRA